MKVCSVHGGYDGIYVSCPKCSDMILCTNPQCQTIAGCVCGARWRPPMVPVTPKSVTWCLRCGLLLDQCDCQPPNSTNITTIPTEVRRPFAPDPKIIDHCERLLADAKSGKLRGLAYGVVYHDGLVPMGEVNWGFHSTVGAAFALGEAISRLRHAWDKDRDG